MFSQALTTSLRIIALRAGPEDFPYDASGRLVAAAVAVATFAYAAFLAFLLPPTAALLAAAAGVAGNWLLTRVVLQRRKLENRVQQTFNALLMTTGLLTIAAIPPFAKLAPAAREMYAQLNQHPDFLNQPDKWPRGSPGASLLVDILMIWQLVVCARIFGRAANAGALGGLAITVLGGLGLMLLGSLLSSLVASLFG